MTLDEQIAALPPWPKMRGEMRYIQESASVGRLWIPLETAEAHLALTRRALRAMVDDCKTCFGNGTMTMPIMYSPTGKPSRPCPRCADARRVLEVTK